MKNNTIAIFKQSKAMNMTSLVAYYYCSIIGYMIKFIGSIMDQ